MIINFLKKITPKKILSFLLPIWHYSLAFLGAIIYHFPSNKLKVYGVTGTKGKTTTVELLSNIFTEAGYKTALAGTLHFVINGIEEKNDKKMTMPGRFFLQKFLRKCIKAHCDIVILEMSSEGAKQYRHKFINLDGLIFTNISPEHIEAHGSYENYLRAKIVLVKELEKSNKKNKIIAINKDDKEFEKFLDIKIENKNTFSIKDAEPYKINEDGMEFTLRGQNIKSSLCGIFNLYNIIGASTLALGVGINIETTKRAVEKFSGIAGRMESVNMGQNFKVVVDYAHTPDSLEKVYQFFQNRKKICILGSAGGGRDKWKRAEMGKIAGKYCEKIILTNEDPYDEDPYKIINEVSLGIEEPIWEIEVDRRIAISKAIASAQEGDAVIITGKGAELFIMGPNGQKTPWSDVEVIKEELGKNLNLQSKKML